MRGEERIAPPLEHSTAVTSAHDRLRRRLGRVGVWTFAFDARPARTIAGDVRAIEAMGFPSLWI
ncbi:MAG TPA: hypothetical protein VF108_13490, partial [Actinomycetota bacterium]